MVKCPICCDSFEAWTCDFCGKVFMSQEVPTKCPDCGKDWKEAYCKGCGYSFIGDWRTVYGDWLSPAGQMYYCTIDPNSKFGLSWTKGHFFRTFSLLQATEYNPRWLQELETGLIARNDSTREVTLSEPASALLNLCDKLGNMEYAARQVRKLDGKGMLSHIFVRYHTFNGVVSCKGCLDARAEVLNWSYKLGLTRGAVDLDPRRGRVLGKLPRNGELAKSLATFSQWIKDVTDCRDVMIHRQMWLLPTLVSQSRPPDVAWPTSFASLKPVWLPDRSTRPQIHPSVMKGAEFFLEELISKTKQLAELICLDLLERLPSGTG